MYAKIAYHKRKAQMNNTQNEYIILINHLMEMVRRMEKRMDQLESTKKDNQWIDGEQF